MAGENTEVEATARQMGWKPQEEFKGDPAKWVDAEEYVRRGEEVLPLVKAENRRLHEKTDSLTTEIARLKAVVAEQSQSMNEMLEFNQQQLKEKLEEQKRQLTRELRAARKEDDDDRVEELEEALEANTEARGKLKEQKETPPKKPEQTPVETPEYRAWIAANPWFGGNSAIDSARTAAAQRFGVEVAAAGKKGQAFFDAVDEKMKEAFPPAKRLDPTEDGRPSGGGADAPSGGKGFNSLPPEAKQKAREQVSKFVGPNKLFKTEKAWFDYYAQQYA